MRGFIHNFRVALRFMRRDIKAVLDRDPAARSVAEVLLCYPGFHAIFFHRAAHFLWTHKFYLYARWLSHLSRFLTVIGETTVIGRGCTLYQGVTLGGVSLHKGKRHPTLEDGVIVGVGAKILGPHTIGAGSRIGAASVVIADVPPGSTVVGVPGRVVYRNGESSDDPETPAAFAHDKLPDPIETALQALNLRIAELERELELYREADTRNRS
jgi:serine O-acetyltransferase